MTDPRQWRHAASCRPSSYPCECGLSALRRALESGRVVVGPEGVEGVLADVPIVAGFTDRASASTAGRTVHRVVPVPEDPT